MLHGTWWCSHMKASMLPKERGGALLEERLCCRRSMAVLPWKTTVVVLQKAVGEAMSDM